MLFRQKAIQVVEDEMTEEERHKAIVDGVLSGITVRAEYITPERAKELLLKNIKNRNISEIHAGSLGRDFSEGNYIFTGDPIRIDKNGKLMDGQHRLRAVIDSGIPVVMLIIEGLEPEAQEVIDSGRKRSASDALKMRGEKHCAVLAATLRSLVVLRRSGMGAVSHSEKATNSEIMEELDRNPHVREAISSVHSRFPGTTKLMSASLACFLYFICSESDHEDAEIFFDGLSTGAGLSARNPILTLRNKLSTFTIMKSRPKPQIILYMTLRAWQGYRRGEKLKSLPVPARILKWPEV